MVTPAKKAGNRAWDKENMVNLCCRVRKDYAEEVRKKAKERGDTVNAILKAALDKYMEE